jgi:hypothetical protein
MTVRRCGLAVATVLLAVGAWTTGTRATATPTDGIHPPSFADVPYLEVVVRGRTVPLGRSNLTFRRRTVASFDDPQTDDFDATAGATREFLACASDRWSIGNQTFTVDPIALGNARHDPYLVELGARGVDWGVQQRLGSDGVHRLQSSCDDAATADYGGTHHSTQWLASLGEAVYLLRSSPFAAAHTGRIDTYVARMEELADRLTDERNTRVWERKWLVDDEGNLYTHKTYMRAAALGLAASVTDDPQRAARWSAEAERIARRGMAAQRANGVNPERDGYDVAYQMYGTWLAQLYDATLGPGPLQDALRAHIDRAVEWLSGRVDADTGQVDIGASTRVCNVNDASEPYETADAVRVLLTWSLVRGRPELAERAVLVDHGAKTAGNPCPDDDSGRASP